MDNLFEEINLQWSNRFFSWGFKYKGQAYMHIIESKEGMSEKAQIISIEDMIKTMKRASK